MNFVFYGEVVVVWITAKQMPTIVDKEKERETFVSIHSNGTMTQAMKIK